MAEDDDDGSTEALTKAVIGHYEWKLRIEAFDAIVVGECHRSVYGGLASGVGVPPSTPSSSDHRHAEGPADRVRMKPHL
jgi:hypothetical protein